MARIDAASIHDDYPISGPPNTQATFTFPGTSGAYGMNGVLADGNYEATLLADKIPLVGLNDDHTSEFFYLTSDADHDRSVDSADQAILSSHYGQSGVGFSNGDLNYDGHVDFTDWTYLAAKYGVFLHEPPTIPLQSVANTVSESEIDVTWADYVPPQGEPDESGYHIYRSLDGSTFEQVGTAAQDETHFLDYGLPDGTKVWYKVRPFTDDGDAAAVNRTWSVTVLGAPSDVYGEAIAPDVISLHWTNNSSTQTRLILEWGESDQEYDHSLVLEPDESSKLIGGLDPAVMYKFQLHAENDQASSAPSYEATATTLPSSPQVHVFGY